LGVVPKKGNTYDEHDNLLGYWANAYGVNLYGHDSESFTVVDIYFVKVK